MTAMEEASKKSPNKSIDVKRLLRRAIRSLPITRRANNPARFEYRGPFISQVANGESFELWDVGQMIAKDSPNENGPF